MTRRRISAFRHQCSLFGAVAVTIATVGGSVPGAVGGALFPRIAEGDITLAARSCRITMCVVAISCGVLAVLSPAMIPFVFGAEFAAATKMAVILLAASIPLAAATVLGSAVSAANAPAAAMRAELVGLGVTVPALIVLLPSAGGTGAAVVSLMAYSLRAVMLLRSAARTFELPWWSFVLPTTADVNWLVSRLRQLRPWAPRSLSWRPR